MASACEESSCWNLEWLQPAHFPLEYLIVILHAIFLFTLSPLCLSLSPSLSLFPLLPTPNPKCHSFLAVLSHSFVFLLGGGLAVVAALNKHPEQIRHFYNALLVGGRGAGRSRDWREGMMYVAAVSLLSSSPLSLITAISFFQSCLVCTVPQKSHCFSCHRLREKREERNPSTFFFSSSLLPPRISLLSCLLPIPTLTPVQLSFLSLEVSMLWWLGGNQSQTLIASSVPVFYAFIW